MSEERRGCFKYGCFGCLSLIGIGVFVLIVLGVLQFFASRGDRATRDASVERVLPQDIDLRSALPADLSEALFASRSGGAVEGSSDGEGGEATDDSQSTGPELEAFDASSIEGPIDLGTLDLPEMRFGTVVLDLSVGEFEIRAGAPGEPARISGQYEEGKFELEEELTQSDDGTWSYRVRFGPKRGFFGMLLSGGGDNPQNRLTITLPRDVGFDLVGELGVGETNIDLGGLFVRDLDLDMGIGEHKVEVSEPMPFAMSSMRIQKSIGSFVVRDVGHASPSVVELSARIGESRVDLRGPWTTDAQIDVTLGIGEGTLRLPEGVAIELDGDVSIGERNVRLPDASNLPEGAPTLVLNTNVSIGEMSVD